MVPAIAYEVIEVFVEQLRPFSALNNSMHWGKLNTLATQNRPGKVHVRALVGLFRKSERQDQGDHNAIHYILQTRE